MNELSKRVMWLRNNILDKLNDKSLDRDALTLHVSSDLYDIFDVYADVTPPTDLFAGYPIKIDSALRNLAWYIETKVGNLGVHIVANDRLREPV